MVKGKGRKVWQPLAGCAHCCQKSMRLRTTEPVHPRERSGWGSRKMSWGNPGSRALRRPALLAGAPPDFWGSASMVWVQWGPASSQGSGAGAGGTPSQTEGADLSLGPGGGPSVGGLAASSGKASQADPSWSRLFAHVSVASVPGARLRASPGAEPGLSWLHCGLTLASWGPHEAWREDVGTRAAPHAVGVRPAVRAALSSPAPVPGDEAGHQGPGPTDGCPARGLTSD